MFEELFTINMGLFYAFLGVLLLTFLDVVLGIALSLKRHVFDLSKFPQFLKTQVLPYLIPLAALVGMAQFKDFNNIGTVSMAGVVITMYVAKQVKEIVEKLKMLYAPHPKNFFDDFSGW
ncbi:MAG: hypothetical protein DDT33_00779 [Firmicutes bacterium]|nr:hypothetical protein [Bacillota bacterium]